MTRALQLITLVLLAALAIAALHYAVYLPLVCEASVSRAAFGMEMAVDRSEAVKLGAARFTLESLQPCHCLEGEDFKLPFALGTAYHDQGRIREAIEAYQRALSIDRRPGIYLALGMAQLDARAHVAAIDSFVEAGAFDPSSLADIPYDTVREETKSRIRSMYGADWIP